jgi:hypothetical protein
MLEIFFRLFGFQPFDAKSRERLIELFEKSNNGKQFFIADSLLGYKLDTGIYYIPLDDESIFIATNDKWGYRNQIGNKEASNIHFYGCSVTYGICVEDNEVFSEVLNRISPNNHFFNFGVPSYSMVQSYLQFKNNLETGFVPEKAFFIYGSFHNERSAMSNTWVKNFSRKNFDFEVPYINKNTEENYNIKHKELTYNYGGGILVVLLTSLMIR